MLRLGYCTNVHHAETWDEVRATLERDVPAVKARLGASGPFGVGLRLSNLAACSLADPAPLRDVLAQRGLFVFTLNGFPYGPFGDRAPVKERVYRPDWLEPERVAYTARLARILAAVLPRGMEGSISTLPIAYRERRPAFTREGSDDLAATSVLEAAAALVAMERETGARLVLALEPEPFCRLETIGDAIGFFEGALFGPALDGFAKTMRTSRKDAEELVRRVVGVCIDACHLAVENESPRFALRALDGAGIRIAKVQLGAGLRVRFPDERALRELSSLADPVFLHQVVELRDDGTTRRFLDLPEALLARDGHAREWRIHHHVPLHQTHLGAIETTQDVLVELIDALVARAGDALVARAGQGELPALEAETYTWNVLPRSYRAEHVVDDLARELAFVRARLTPAATPRTSGAALAE